MADISQISTNVIHIKKVKSFFCELCEYSTYSQCHLNNHLNSIHLGIKDVKCDYCDKLFIHKSSLNDHINSVHKQMTRHTCDLCDFASYKKSYLERHLNTVHLGKKVGCPLFEYLFEYFFVKIIHYSNNF
jgi:uncharacterized Zn-finger protein